MLTDFFKMHPKVAIAFSGGVDSSYLFYAAVKSGADVCGYYVKSELQPEFELRDAMKLASDIGGEMKILRTSILDYPDVTENSSIRCYNCKKRILGLISKEAKADGFELIIDGNNASDIEGDRPGMKAVLEMGVLSPLKEAGLTKQDIRELSREAGLFTWDKPAYSCLATRIPTGRQLTGDLLSKIERSEGILFELGFTDFRVRSKDENTAFLQFPALQLETAKKMWDTIKNKLSVEFSAVELDLNPRA